MRRRLFGVGITHQALSTGGLKTFCSLRVYPLALLLVSNRRASTPFDIAFAEQSNPMNEHGSSWHKVDAGAPEAGPTIGGEQSPPFSSRWEMAMKELSIFCDESGDFGPTSNHSPRYLIGLVLHDQSKDIGPQIERFRGELQGHSFTAYAPIHTAPLIRREERYAEIDGKTRRKLFDILSHFSDAVTSSSR